MRARPKAIEQRHILTKKVGTKAVNVFFYEDDTVGIVLRQLEPTAQVGEMEAINPFMATETYHRQADGTWKMLSFVYTRIMPKNHTYRFMA